MSREEASPPDAELARRLRRGDAGAFDLVYARYHERIWRHLHRLTRSRAAADDLFQDTWLKVVEHAPRLSEDTHLAAYLFTIASNRARSHRRWAFLRFSRTEPIEDEPPGAAPSAEVDAAAREEILRVDRVMQRLPPEQSEVLCLLALEGFDAAQAAAILGIREDAVRKRASRARAALREGLEKERVRPPAPSGKMAETRTRMTRGGRG